MNLLKRVCKLLLPSNLCTAMLALPLFCFVCVAPLSIANENLEPILKLVLELDDPSFQRDLLKGMREGLAGKRNLDPPLSYHSISDHSETLPRYLQK